MDEIYGDKLNINPIAIASNMRANENMISTSEDSVTEETHKPKKS